MRARRHVAGFTYLTALFMIAFMAAGLALAGEMWETAARREREAELLFVGNQYRLAIQRYYLSGTAQYPRTLQDLLKDPRSPATRRHLRQLYPDPITGSADWTLVKGPDGGIMGVRSRSEEAPLKVANFRFRDRELAGAKKYSDWIFFYSPSAQQPQAKPGAAVPAPPGMAPPSMPGAPTPPGMAPPPPFPPGAPAPSAPGAGTFSSSPPSSK